MKNFMLFFFFGSCLSVIDFQNTFLLSLLRRRPPRLLLVLGAHRACVGRSDIIEVLLDCDAYFSFPLLYNICPQNTHALEWSSKVEHEGKAGGKKENKTRKNVSLTIDNYRLFFSILHSLFTPARQLSVVGLALLRTFEGARFILSFNKQHIKNDDEKREK